MNQKRAIWLKKQEKSHILFEDVLSAAHFSQLRMRTFLKPVSFLYPHFEAWLNFTFVRQIGEGKRQAIIAHDGHHIFGCSLLKISGDENKICTFFVHPDAREQGLANDLMRRSLERFDDRPIISVSEERSQELYPILRKYGFNMYSSVDSIYRKNKSEYFYVAK